MTPIVRPFRADDLAPLMEIMRQTLDLPELETSAVVRDFLLAADFTPDTLLIAEVDGLAAGFVLAPAGWIVAFGVMSAHRGCGLATALLVRALAAMRRDGVRRVDVADIPVRYLLPGVDRVAFPEAFGVLTKKFGFTTRDEVASMGRSLADAPPALVDAGLRACAPGEYPLLRNFLCDEFGPDWWVFFHRSIIMRLEGNPTPSDIFCHWVDGVPLGAVHFRGRRFGPLAVSARLRGQGIGARLTHAALAAMQTHGFADTYFLSGAQEVQPFYRRLGFRVLRNFTRLTLAL